MRGRHLFRRGYHLSELSEGRLPTKEEGWPSAYDWCCYGFAHFGSVNPCVFQVPCPTESANVSHKTKLSFIALPANMYTCTVRYIPYTCSANTGSHGQQSLENQEVPAPATLSPGHPAGRQVAQTDGKQPVGAPLYVQEKGRCLNSCWSTSLCPS